MITQLPAGHVGCRICGRATPRPDADRIYRAEPQDVEGNPSSLPKPAATEEMTLCAEDQRLHDLAVELINTHPAAARHYGDSVALTLAEGTLVALFLLGKDMPSVEISDAELGRLLRALGQVGRAAMWSRRFEPVRLRRVRSGVCADPAFSDVTKQEARQLKRAGIDLFADELAAEEAPRRIAPPPVPDYIRQTVRKAVVVEGGCLFCGVGHVEVPAARVRAWADQSRREVTPPSRVLDSRIADGFAPEYRKTWRGGLPMGRVVEGPPMTADQIAAGRVWTHYVASRSQLSTVRVERGPQRVAGWLCSSCDPAAQSKGGVTLSALELALFTWAGQGSRYRPFTFEVKVLGFGAVVANAVRRGEEPPAPNDMPWAHVGSPDEVAEMILNAKEPIARLAVW